MAPPTGGWKEQGKVRVQFAEPYGSRKFELLFNGTKLEPTNDISEPYPNKYPNYLGTSETLLAWKLPAGIIHDGKNDMKLRQSTGDKCKVVFIDIAVK
jgi:hypothetical protein